MKKIAKDNNIDTTTLHMDLRPNILWFQMTGQEKDDELS